ncbi:transporter [Tenacibaculum holothuriorum]|uniref:Transporter n=1 Tax=Tenacibaculum holothuriorum TaxID=1635173 RepID=A0A1Y2PEC0_9FLAO|nr:TolC family protein [Tenacibaculum holothuriorum]OSY88833.1 transporter [Tenacibaculum holothuriorum]
MKTKIVLLATLLLSVTATFSQKKWTLKECVDYALKNNISVKQNQLNVQLAEKDVAIAKGNFLPDLNASGGSSFAIGPVINQVTNTRVGSTNSLSGSGSVTSSINVFNGFRNLNTKKQALLGVEGSKLDLQVIENDISLNVVNTYLNVLFAKENLSVAQVQAEISKKQIERAQAQFDAGAIPKGDLLNVQSTAVADAQNVVTQENTLNLALLRLAQLLQVSSDNFDVEKLTIDSPSSAMLYNSATQVYNKALTNRPEIDRAELNVKNSELAIDIQKSAYYPTVTASAGARTNFYYDLERDLGEPGLFKQLNNQLNYSLGVNVNIPIFNRLQTKNRVAKSIISKENSELALENQKLQLRQTIEQAYLDAKAAAKTFEAAKISLEAQNEAFKNAQESYNYGAMTQFDYDQVRNRKVNAEGAMIRAKYDYVFRTKVLKFYFGESIID